MRPPVRPPPAQPPALAGTACILCFVCSGRFPVPEFLPRVSLILVVVNKNHHRHRLRHHHREGASSGGPTQPIRSAPPHWPGSIISGEAMRLCSVGQPHICVVVLYTPSLHGSGQSSRQVTFLNHRGKVPPEKSSITHATPAVCVAAGPSKRR